LYITVYYNELLARRGVAYRICVALPVNMAPFSKEGKVLIKSLFECKGYNVTMLGSL